MKSRTLSDKSKILISALIVLCSYIIVAVFYPMQYYTHDETDIQYTLSGAFSGTPYPNHPYINIILGKVLSGLYTLIPTVQWWYLFGSVLLIAGAVLVYFSVFKVFEKNDAPLFLPLTIILGINFVFIVPLIANYAYTLIGAVFGTGILSGYFWITSYEKRKRIIYYVLSVVGYILVYIYRKETGAVILCFLLLTFAIFVTTEYGWGIKNILKVVAICMCFVVITLGLTVIKNKSDEKYNGQEYTRFFDAWRNCRDYPFDTIEKNPDLYKEAGWGEYEYWMFRSYRGSTDAMTTESYEYIHENSLERTAYRKHIKEGVEKAFKDGEFLGCLFAYATILAVVIIAVIKDFSLTFLFWLLCNNGGFAVLSAYLLLKGRFIYRAAYVIFLPAIVINICLVARNSKARINRYLVTALVATLSIVSSWGYFSTKTDRKEALEKCKAITEYELSNKDNAFICLGSTYENFNPWKTFAEEKPINHMYGYSFRWGVSKEQMKANGFDEKDELSPFISDKTLFLTEWDCEKKKTDIKFNNSFYCYYDYLKMHNDCVGFVKLDEIPNTNVCVYKLLFEGEDNPGTEVLDIVEGDVVEVK